MNKGDEAQRVFSESGLRCTRQRRALYTALAASRSHPTADELHRCVEPLDPAISLATVYNTLEAFCRAGLAQKLPGAGANGSARFDAVCDNHLHVRCRDSGAIADVPADLSRRLLDHIPESVLKDLQQQLKFQVDEVQIQLVGRYASD